VPRSARGLGTAYTQSANAFDYTLRIAPLRLELAPGKTIDKTIDTFAHGDTLCARVGRAA
jgi:hypothetical protein